MNPLDLVKNLQQMQSKMAEVQAKIQTIRVEGRAGGDMVRVLMDGTFFLVSITMSADLVEQNDVDMIQDLTVAACADAHAKVKAAITNEMGGMAGSISFLNQMMGQ